MVGRSDDVVGWRLFLRTFLNPLLSFSLSGRSESVLLLDPVSSARCRLQEDILE